MKFSTRDREALTHIVEEDYRGAVADHQRRMERFRRYYQLWRNRVDPPLPGDEKKPNYQVPLLQWHVFTKWATMLDQLLGDDAEIIAVPVGPSDHRMVKKVERFMQWRVFNDMKILKSLATFTFRMILFCRSIAYSPWLRETYQTPEGEQVWYEGPGFKPCWPGEIVVPAEDACTIHDFSFVIRRVWLTPQQLLAGEREGRYFDIRSNWEDIVNFSTYAQNREDQPDKEEADEAQGVTFDGSLVGKGTIEVHEWFGKYRPVKGAKPSFDEHELVCRFLPDLNMLIGVDNLMDLYPQQRHRRPFVEGSLIEDGSYWGPGFGELLESIQDERTAVHRLLTRGMQFSVGPVIFYKPHSGFNANTFEYEPFTTHPTEDPHSVLPVAFKGNLDGPVVVGQALEGHAQSVLGQSEQNMGRTIDRPNAPRTAAGQISLIEQGNIRGSLDVKMLRDTMSQTLSHFWDLESSFGSGELFFRVTEEDAKGLFSTKNGGAYLTPEERAGRFDFNVKFADSYWARESAKQRQLELYQLDLANPLINTNPRALYVITRDLHAKLGDPNFGDMLPEPPDLGLPKSPKEEWTLILQDEDVQVHPMDNDDLHLVDHLRRLRENKTSTMPDPQAQEEMITHILKHQEQKRQKMMMKVLTDQLATSLQQNTQMPGAPGLNAGGQAVSLMDLSNVLGDLTGQNPPLKPNGGASA